MQSRFSVLFLLTCFMLSTACFSNQNTLTFNRPDNVPQANYVLELLTLAYKDIGYEIHLIDFNPQNALRAANNGTLDGQLGRDNSIEVDFPNLLPVNYPLFKFKLILYKGICRYNNRICQSYKGIIQIYSQIDTEQFYLHDLLELVPYFA